MLRQSTNQRPEFPTALITSANHNAKVSIQQTLQQKSPFNQVKLCSIDSSSVTLDVFGIVIIKEKVMLTP